MSPLPAQAELELYLQQTQYASDPTYETQSNQYSNVLPSVSGKRSFLAGKITLKGDASFVLPLSDEGEFHGYSRDAYIRFQDATQNGTTLAVTVGRSQRLWSTLDSDWGLGLWEPLFRWDYVNPVQMGLTGVFVEAIGNNIKGTLFASPIFLPDQQGDFEVENGKLVSGNRWFRAPVSRLEIDRGSSRIFYDLRKPEISDVVNNPAFAGSVVAGDEDNGLWARLSAADKPMNQFHVIVQTDNVLQLHTNELHPVIYPTVVRHQIATFELGYSWDDRNKVFASIIGEKIDKPAIPEGWEQTELNDAKYFGVGGDVSLGQLGLRQSLLSLGYVQREKDKSGGDSAVEGNIEASSQRILFEKLASVAIGYPIYPQSRNRWMGQLKYTHSFSDDGDWVSAQMSYSPEKHVTWHLGMDFLGASNEVDVGRSFISTYRNNDRVFGGLSYVF